MPNGPGLGENIGRNPAPGPNRAQRFFGDPRFAQIIQALAPLLISKLGGGPDMGFGAMQGIGQQQDFQRQLGQDQFQRQQAQQDHIQRQDALQRTIARDDEMRTARAWDDIKPLLAGIDSADMNTAIGIADEHADLHQVPTQGKDRLRKLATLVLKGQLKGKKAESKFFAHPKGEGILEESPENIAKYGTGELGMLGFQGPFSERGGAEFQARTIQERQKPSKETEGDISRGLAAAYFREKHKLPPDKPLNKLQQARANVEYDAYGASLKPRDPSIQSFRQMSQTLQLSNSLKSHPAYRDMLDIQTGMEGTEVGLAQKNGFGDIAAINAFQVMIDPGATVREGDVSLLQTGAALIDRILSDFPIQKLRTGAKLPDATRAMMLKTAKELYARRAKNYNETIGLQYRGLAKNADIPFELIGQDFSISAPGTTTTGPAAGTIEDGYRFKGGNPADQKNWEKVK